MKADVADIRIASIADKYQSAKPDDVQQPHACQRAGDEQQSLWKAVLFPEVPKPDGSEEKGERKAFYP